MPNIVGSLPVAIIIVVGVCAPLAGWLARQRARNPALWFVFGALLGPIAPLLLVAAPLGRCPRCGTRAQGWSGTAPSAGRGLGGVFDEGDARRPTGRQPAPPRAGPAPPTVARPAHVGRATDHRLSRDGGSAAQGPTRARRSGRGHGSGHPADQPVVPGTSRHGIGRCLDR